MKQSETRRGETQHVGHDPRPMPGTLRASSPDRQVGRAPRSLLGSIIVHGVIIGAHLPPPGRQL